MVNFPGMAGGSWLWGAVAERSSVPVPPLIGASALFVCTIVGLRFPLESSSARDLNPLGRWAAPSTIFTVDERAGPVVIAVEWRIAEPDVSDFLQLMLERRRIRRRDGAHHWALLRDVADAELWVERYQAPTWTDYVRLNNCPTRDDATILDRLRELHLGEGGPCIRHLVDHGLRVHAASSAATARELATPLTDPTRVA